MNFFDVHITEQAKKNVQEVLDSGFINEGEWVERFENALETQFGYKTCVAVNSCTSALHLALILSGVGKGDEVILPAQTFVATGLSVLYCGATPVFADINRITGNIDVNDVFLNKITKKTKAVIAVSWGGNPCDLPVLEKVCRDRNIYLIQDNAQALGATLFDRSLTEWGDFSCYSFQAIKHVTSGDGGMLVCNNDIPAKCVAQETRWFGIDKELNLPDETGERHYNLHNVGYKYNMNNISAALGIGNLQGFEIRQKIRNGIADIYNKNLPQHIRTMAHDGNAYWLYDILVDNRAYLMDKLRERDIPCSVVHVGIDRNDIFGGYQDLPNQRYWDEHHLCLPIHSSMTEEDAYKVVDVVKESLK